MHAIAIVFVLALAACRPAPPPVTGGSVPASTAPSAPPTVAMRAVPPSSPLVLPSMELPPGPIYLCEVAGARTMLELAESLENLCRRHPEMGPCRFERDACRRRGGRVFTSRGDEVTSAIESEYARKVRRVTFQADSPPKR